MKKETRYFIEARSSNIQNAYRVYELGDTQFIKWVYAELKTGAELAIRMKIVESQNH